MAGAGKELIENLLVLRLSNLVFQPLWNRNYIRNVQARCAGGLLRLLVVRVSCRAGRCC